jgi:hypothetical protein
MALAGRTLKPSSEPGPVVAAVEPPMPRIWLDSTTRTKGGGEIALAVQHTAIGDHLREAARVRRGRDEPRTALEVGSAGRVLEDAAALPHLRLGQISVRRTGDASTLRFGPGPSGVGHAERVEQRAPHHHIAWRAGAALDQQAAHVHRNRGVDHRAWLERERDGAERRFGISSPVNRPLARFAVMVLLGGADGD